MYFNSENGKPYCKDIFNSVRQEKSLPCSVLAELKTLSRLARAAYLSALALAPSTASLAAPVELLWDVELKDPKSALQDLGKLSKLAKVALASPPEELPVCEKERYCRVTRGALIGWFHEAASAVTLP